MPTVSATGAPYTGVPTVPAQGVPTPPQQIRASPEDFGSLTAQATERLGTQIGQASNTLWDTTKYFSEVGANDLINQYMDKRAAILYGDPNVPGDTGFIGKHGNDAIQDFPRARDALEQARREIGGNAQNGMMLQHFEQESRRQQSFALQDMGRHYDSQMNEYAKTVNKATNDMSLRDAAASGLDDVAFEASTKRLMESRLMEVGRTAGKDTPLDPRVIDDVLEQARADSVEQRVRGLANDQPERAKQILDQNKDIIKGPKYDQLDKEVATRTENKQAHVIAQEALGLRPRAAAGGAAAQPKLVPQGWTPAAYPNAPSESAQPISHPERNNPGNLRVADNAWAGKTTKPGEAFESFATIEHGIRARAITYGTYLSSGTNTIAQIAERSGPASDNNDIPSQIAAYKQALGGKYAAAGGENLPIESTPENIRRLTAGGISIEAGGGGKFLPKGAGMAAIDRTLKGMAAEPEATGSSQAAGGAPSQAGAGIIDKTADLGMGTRFGQLEPVQGMVVHHTAGGKSVEDVINTEKKTGFPAQFIIDRQGKTYQVLPDGYQGRHIRNSYGPLGEGKSNANMEGVEIIADNDGDVLPVQQEAAARLIGQRAQKFGYDPKTSVYGHGELNPGHRQADEGMSTVTRIRNGALPITMVAAPQAKSGGEAPAVAIPEPGAGGMEGSGGEAPPGAVVPAAAGSVDTVTGAKPPTAGAKPIPSPGAALPATAAAPEKRTLADIENDIFSRDVSDNVKLKAWNEAKAHYTAVEADEARQIRQQEMAKKDALHKREDEIWADVYSASPKISASSIATDPAFEGFTEDRQRMIALINNPPGSAIPPAQSSRAAMDLLSRIRLPYGDPQKITDVSTIYDAATGNPEKGIAPRINKTDLEFVKKEFEAGKTANGELLAKTKDALIKRVSGMITKSNPLMGKIDPVGDAELYNFERALAVKIDQYQRENKNPMDLLDPTKPDFAGKPAFLAPFQKSMQESAQDAAKRVNQVPQWPQPGAQTPAVPQRQPGETPEQYLKRTGGGGTADGAGSAATAPIPPPPAPQVPMAR